MNRRDCRPYIPGRQDEKSVLAREPARAVAAIDLPPSGPDRYRHRRCGCRPPATL